MMQPIAATHMVVDLTTCSEILGAQSADIETGTVSVREMTYSGPVEKTIVLPVGIRIVRRR
jgi:hypothetical protein